MNRRPTRRLRGAGRVGVVVLAGWLFADLLLVLALVSMADRPDPLAAARPTGSRSPAPSASPTPSPTGPRSVERAPQRFQVTGTDGKALVAQIRKATARWSGRTAALVLTFGGGLSGTDYAHRVNSVLGTAQPGLFTRNTATDDFLDLSAPQDTATIRVYFYTAPD